MRNPGKLWVETVWTQTPKLDQSTKMRWRLYGGSITACTGGYTADHGGYMVDHGGYLYQGRFYVTF